MGTYIVFVFALVAIASVIFRLNVIIPVLMGVACILYKYMLMHKVKTYNCVYATCIDCFASIGRKVFFKWKHNYMGKYQYELNGQIYTHIDKGFHSSVKLQKYKAYKIYVKNDNPEKCYSENELKDKVYYYGALFCFICAWIVVRNNMIFL